MSATGLQWIFRIIVFSENDNCLCLGWQEVRNTPDHSFQFESRNLKPTNDDLKTAGKAIRSQSFIRVLYILEFEK